MKWPRHICGAPRVVSSVCGWGEGYFVRYGYRRRTSERALSVAALRPAPPGGRRPRSVVCTVLYSSRGADHVSLDGVLACLLA
jgi:hypothetical protein